MITIDDYEAAVIAEEMTDIDAALEALAEAIELAEQTGRPVSAEAWRRVREQLLKRI